MLTFENGPEHVEIAKIKQAKNKKLTQRKEQNETKNPHFFDTKFRKSIVLSSVLLLEP